MRLNTTGLSFCTFVLWCGACTGAFGAVMGSASWARSWRDCKQVRALSASRVVPPFLFPVVTGMFQLLSVVQARRRRKQQGAFCRRPSMDADCQCHCTTCDPWFLLCVFVQGFQLVLSRT